MIENIKTLQLVRSISGGVTGDTQPPGRLILRFDPKVTRVTTWRLQTSYIKNEILKHFVDLESLGEALWIAKCFSALWSSGPVLERDKKEEDE